MDFHKGQEVPAQAEEQRRTHTFLAWKKSVCKLQVSKTAKAKESNSLTKCSWTRTRFNSLSTSRSTHTKVESVNNPRHRFSNSPLD